MRSSLLIFLLALHAGTALAQKTTTHIPQATPHNAVQANLGGLMLDYLNVSYYRTLADHHAVGAYIGYLYHPVGGEHITGYGFGLAYRYYPAGRSLSRFYYSPIIGVQRGEVVRQGRDPAIGLLVSGVLGWQWFVERHFAVGLGLGGRVILGGSDEEDPVIRDAFGASPVVTLDLGYAW